MAGETLLDGAGEIASFEEITMAAGSPRAMFAGEGGSAEYSDARLEAGRQYVAQTLGDA